MPKFSGQYHHGDLAAALEDAAIQLLAERGLTHISLREVARKAGVSHNAPYHHFGDKQGLLKAVTARSLENLLKAVAAGRDSTDTPYARLLAAGEAYIRFAVEHPRQYEAMFNPEICAPHSPDPLIAPLVEANEALLRSAIADVLPDIDQVELDNTAATLWAAVHGLATLVAGGYFSTEQILPSLEIAMKCVTPNGT